MPDLPEGWALAGALNRWVLFGAMLFATGGALVTLWLPVRIGRQGRIAAAVAAACYILAIGLGGADLLGTPAGIFDSRAWVLGFRTTLLASAILGVAGMALLGLGFAANGFRRPLLAGGVALAVTSLLVTGHPVSTPPRVLMALAFALHLLGAAFWLGALPPLRKALTVMAPAAAGQLVTAFSHRALIAVAAIVASGVIIAVVQVGALPALTGTSYGLRLLFKLALVALVLGCAAYNKIVLTPALLRGEGEAPARLRRIITLELALMILVLGAAVALALVAPPRELTGL